MSSTPRPAELATALHLVSDEILVQRAVGGDAVAFEQLVRRHGPLMRACAVRMMGSIDAADDVIQEALCTAWQRLPEVREPSAVKWWLMRIISRQAFTHLRRRRTEEGLPLFERAIPAGSQPESVAIRHLQLTALDAALDALPADQRRCWLLREIAELSYDDISHELGVPRATVRGSLARARSSIHASMEGWR